MQAFRYIKKIHQYGLSTSALIIKDRLTKRFFDHYWRTRARYKKASRSWQSIQKKHKTEISFKSFFSEVTKKNCQFIKEALKNSYKNHVQIIEQANLYQQQCFSLLGSRPACYLEIPWHTDFRLQQHNESADCYYDSNAYYKDIKIEIGSSTNLSKDIKVPWELSRLQHFFVLGQAYSITQEKKYVTAFVHQFSDWQTKNPYLLGPAWMCPMDVGLRAVNLALSFYVFKNDETISQDFWQKYVCCLYDHLVYLEHNWEVYDYKTSNHYLSDLIGYYYLCSFFSALPGIQEKLLWCHQELLHEWDKQIFDEGTDYEDSTSYHRLIAELFHHMLLVSTDNNLQVPKKYYDKFERMINFLSWCSADGGSLIQIGDNDSGTIVNGILPNVLQEYSQVEYGIKNYQQFGLSIIKTPQWHLSLRHHAYQEKQPSGHFHNDWASVTLSYQGIPFIVDPGSYIYTPSAYWRNYFRSAVVHNGFYVEGQEPVPFDERLFALAIPENFYHCSNDDKNIISTFHDLYSELQLQRKVQFDECNKQTILEDSWTVKDYEKYKNKQLVWNFTLGHQIKPIKNEAGIVLRSNNNNSLLLTSDLDFQIIDGWLSMNYGSKVTTKKLQTRTPIKKNIFIRTIIKVI